MSGNRPGRLVLATVLASAVGMMWAGAWLLIRPQLGARTWLRTVVLAVAGFLALGLWSVSPIQILIGAALVGAIWIDDMGGPEMASQTPHPRHAPAKPGRSSTSRS